MIDRSRFGLFTLFLGTLLLVLVSIVPPLGVLSLVGVALLLVGAVSLLLGCAAFGAAHARNVVLGLALVAFVFIATYGFLRYPQPPDASATPEAWQAFRAAVTRVLALQLAAYAATLVGALLVTYALQRRIGQALLWAALAVGFVPASLGFVWFVSGARGGFPIGAFSAASLLLFSAAYFLAWRRVDLEEIP